MTMQAPYLIELSAFLRQQIDREIKRVTEEELDKTAKRIEERKDEIIAGVVLHVNKLMQIESLKDELVITVLKQ